MQVSRDQASDFEPDGVAGLAVLPDFQSPGLHILGNADDHPVCAAQQNRSHDPVQNGHRHARAHGAQLCSANLDFTARQVLHPAKRLRSGVSSEWVTLWKIASLIPC